MRKTLLSFIMLGVFVVAGVTPAGAIDPDERLDDATLEARAQEIGVQLRCVVCKSQSIEASDAPLARDLRLIVRERLVAGDSDEAILDYVAARYGAYVLLKPPVQTNTIILWLTPIGVLALGGVAVVSVLRGRKTESATQPLNTDEAAAINALTADHNAKERP